MQQAWDSAGRGEPARDRPIGLALAAGLALLVAGCAFVQGGSSSAGLALGAGTVLLAGGAAAVLVAAGRLPAPRTTPAGWVALAGLAAWAALAFASTAWSLSPQLSWVDGLRTLAALGAFVAGLFVGTLLRRPATALCLAFATVGAVVLGWSVVDRSFAAFVTAQTSPRLSAPLGYANALAALAALMAPAALWLAVAADRRVRAAAAAVLGLAVFVLPLTASRGGILALLVALAVWFGAGRERLRSAAALAGAVAGALPGAVWAVSLPTFTEVGRLFPEPAGARLVVVAALSVAASALLAGVLVELVERLEPAAAGRVGRLAALAAAAGAALLVVGYSATHGGPIDAVRKVWDGFAGEGEVSPGPERLLATGSNLRGRWWGEAWDAFTDEPVHGVGAGTFRIVDQLLRPDVPITREAHSLLFHVLSGLGVLGLAAALTAVLAAGVAATGSLHRLAPGERGAALAVLAGLAGFAFHNLLDWDWNFVALTLLAWGAAGALAAAGLPRPGRPDVVTRIRAGLAVPVALVAAVCAVLPYLGEQALDRADSFEAADQRDAALVEADLARALEPLSTDAQLRTAALMQDLGRERDARRAVKRALELEPLNWNVWATAGEFELACWGEEAKGRRSLDYAVRISGRDPGALARREQPTPICARGAPSSS